MGKILAAGADGFIGSLLEKGPNRGCLDVWYQWIWN